MPDPDEILPRTAWTDYSGGTMDHTWSDALTSDARYDKKTLHNICNFAQIYRIFNKFHFQQAKEKAAKAGIGATALTFTHWRRQGRNNDICFHMINLFIDLYSDYVGNELNQHLQS